jgi:TonB family protein
VLFSATGKVEKVQVLSGNPLLTEAAASTAKKYRFKPYIKDGKPTELWTKIPLDFYFRDKVVDLSKNALSGPVTPSASGNAATPAVSNAPVPAVNEAASPSASPGNSTSSGTADAATPAPTPATLTEQESKKLLTHQIEPFYPHAARRNHIEGTVILKAVIGKDGRISSLTPLSGPPELIPATLGAVEQWRYRPYLLAGKAVEVETVVTVNFSLKH